MARSRTLKRQGSPLSAAASVAAARSPPFAAHAGPSHSFACCHPPPRTNPQPWAMSTVMFCGMSMCLPLAFWVERRERRRAAKAAAAAANGDATEPLLASGVSPAGAALAGASMSGRVPAAARRCGTPACTQCTRTTFPHPAAGRARGPQAQRAVAGADAVHPHNLRPDCHCAHERGPAVRWAARPHRLAAPPGCAACAITRCVCSTVPICAGPAWAPLQLGLPGHTLNPPLPLPPAVTASVYQMMRGAEMLFAALFAVVFLRRSLNRWHYGGIGCCMLGITLVGVSSMLSGERAGGAVGCCALAEGCSRCSCVKRHMQHCAMPCWPASCIRLLPLRRRGQRQP